MKNFFNFLKKKKIKNNSNVSTTNVFERNPDKIYALQRSEILDEHTCNFCLSIDGIVVPQDDKLTSVDLFCKDCRGIWVQIMKEEIDPPPITGVSNEIRNCFHIKSKTLIQLSDPIVKPDSLAKDEIERREREKTFIKI